MATLEFASEDSGSRFIKWLLGDIAAKCAHSVSSHAALSHALYDRRSVHMCIQFIAKNMLNLIPRFSKCPLDSPLEGGGARFNVRNVLPAA